MPRRDGPLRQSLALSSNGVGRRVAGGVGFQLLGIGLRTLLTFGSTAFLARLLTPADFGYVAMATVVTEFAALMGTFGFSSVLVQRRVICRLQLDTLFWTLSVIGLLLALFVFGFSFVAVRVFDDATVGPLLRVMALNFAIGGLTAVPWVVLSRLMRFGANFWIGIVTVVVRMAVAIGCAYAGLGMWSLVIGSLVGTITNAVMHFAYVPFLPRWRYHWPFIARTWKTSASYFGNTALYYASMNLDLLLIGRRLGAAPLGYYQNARALTEEIRGRIAMPIQQVLFPAFSSLQNDAERFGQLVQRAGRLLAAAVVPVGVGVSANAEALVLALYGEQWTAMIPVMAMFGFAAALRASTAISIPLFNANDQAGLAFRYNVVGTLLTMAGVLVTMPFGVTAVAGSVAVTSLFGLATLARALKLIGLPASALYRMLAAPAVASAAMFLATWAASCWLHGPAPLRLLIQVAGGSVVYLGVLHLLSRQYLADFRQLVGVLRQRAKQ